MATFISCYISIHKKVKISPISEIYLTDLVTFQVQSTNITTLEKVCSSFVLKCQSFMRSGITEKSWFIAFTNDCLRFPFVLSKYSWVCFYECLSIRKNSAYHCPFDMKQWTQCKIISVLGFLQCQAWILSSSLLLCFA